MRLLRQLVFKNIGLKLLALGISFFLWATYTAEPFAEVGYNVPIAFANVPRTLAVAGDVPTNARVLVRGRAGLVRQLTASDLNVSVNLSNARLGETDIHLDAGNVGVPYGAEVVRVTPGDFHVTLVPSTAPEPQAE
jgi:YbbR-like protein